MSGGGPQEEDPLSHPGPGGTPPTPRSKPGPARDGGGFGESAQPLCPGLVCRLAVWALWLVVVWVYLILSLVSVRCWVWTFRFRGGFVYRIFRFCGGFVYPVVFWGYSRVPCWGLVLGPNSLYGPIFKKKRKFGHFAQRTQIFFFFNLDRRENLTPTPTMGKKRTNPPLRGDLG